jgi:hypothetical protein
MANMRPMYILKSNTRQGKGIISQDLVPVTASNSAEYTSRRQRFAEIGSAVRFWSPPRLRFLNHVSRILIFAQGDKFRMAKSVPFHSLGADDKSTPSGIIPNPIEGIHLIACVRPSHTLRAGHAC